MTHDPSINEQIRYLELRLNDKREEYNRFLGGVLASLFFVLFGFFGSFIFSMFIFMAISGIFLFFFCLARFNKISSDKNEIEDNIALLKSKVLKSNTKQSIIGSALEPNINSQIRPSTDYKNNIKQTVVRGDVITTISDSVVNRSNIGEFSISTADELQKLKNLYLQGELSDSEYKKAKSKLLK